MQQYIRIFMPLNSETNGYEYNGKTPVGRCLLESRSGIGKLVLWVQDLKPEILYRVHLIFKDGSGYMGLPLCALTIRPNGKAELRHSFNAADIEGCGLALDQCQAVVIITGAGRNAASPLCGYREGPLPWRSGFKIFERNMAAEKIPDDTSKEPETPEEIPEDISKEPETLEEIPSEEPLILSSPPPSPQPSSNAENSLSAAFKEEVDAILNSHTHMHPFQKQNRHVNWVRISLNENLSLPKNICDLLNTPFVEAAYRRYSHLILGKTADSGVLRYYIGVPAAYDPEDKAVGFRQFKCSMDNEPAYGDYGYWLVFMS